MGNAKELLSEVPRVFRRRETDVDRKRKELTKALPDSLKKTLEQQIKDLENEINDDADTPYKKKAVDFYEKLRHSDKAAAVPKNKVPILKAAVAMTFECWAELRFGAEDD